MSSSVVRLYVEAALQPGASISLSDSQHHYVAHVMRRKPQDVLAVFNDADGEWLARIVSMEKKSTMLLVETPSRAPEPRSNVVLCFAPVKNAAPGFIAQKATELDVGELQPVRTERTIVSHVNEEKIRLTLMEAAEQCERVTLPVLAPMLSLSAWLAGVMPEDMLMFADESGAGVSLFSALMPLREKAVSCPRIFVLIGPEGGFSEAERAVIRAHPATVSLSLGPRILRADTAAIAALACVQSAFHFFKGE